MTGGTPLRTLDEDDLLDRILPALRQGRRPARRARATTPPCCAPRSATVATTDTAVLGRDWLDAWSSGADIGHKVIVQNLADVAAMGGTPTGVLVTLVADPGLSLEWVLDHAAAWREACAAADVAVLGGDLSSAPPGVVMVSVTALGRLDGRAGAALGREARRRARRLRLARPRRRRPAPARAGREERHPLAVDASAPPGPRWPRARALRASGATAMLDVSDGLVRDGGRIARASGVVIDLDRAGLEADVDALTEAVGRRGGARLRARRGEEHSLLATFPAALLPDGLAGHRVASVRRVTASGRASSSAGRP